MPSRPRTQVISWVSWDIPCILYSTIIKTKFLLFEFTSLSETNLKTPHYGIAANALTNINALRTKISGKQPQNTKTLAFHKQKNVYTTVEHYNIG
jgi:hypothetical protein